MKWKVI